MHQKPPVAHNPPSVRKPFGRYSHGLEVALPGGGRMLTASGQLGLTVDDVIPEDIEAQAALCFDALKAILESAGMDFSHVVRLGGFVTDRAYFQTYMRVRDRYTSDPPPASTLLVISGFTRPEFKVEVELTAIDTRPLT
jgi:2-iminobutanoate/2-iminopropanoate deaminase